LKIAKVLPIYKKGDTIDLCNYHPILLPTISKLFKRAIHNQYWFRKHYSTINVILNI